jgi:hypothetical protein
MQFQQNYTDTPARLAGSQVHWEHWEHWTGPDSAEREDRQRRPGWKGKCNLRARKKIQVCMLERGIWFPHIHLTHADKFSVPKHST